MDNSVIYKCTNDITSESPHKVEFLLPVKT